MITGPYEKAKRYIESHSRVIEPHRTTGPCITFSRQTGAGADVISERLCDYLQNKTLPPSVSWTVFERNLIKKVIEDHHLPIQITSYFEERKYSELQTTLNELLGIHPPVKALIHKTSETILQLASLGFVIIIGRGANVITKRLYNSFHVRLVAPLENRIKHIQEIMQMTYSEAHEYIKRNDQMREKYLAYHFNKNINDPRLYHLTINTGEMHYSESAELLGLYVIKKFPEFFLSPTAKC